jgi:23S rRNA (adenine2030-N6)-methyltransferase
MFSYRHAFHAGNHADVLKHLIQVAVLRHLVQKETAISVIDTHAGAGVYRLDQEQALTSGESQNGLGKLAAAAKGDAVPLLVQNYLQAVAALNPEGGWCHYPGSPWISLQFLRAQDRLKLFEVHPTDARLLDRHVADVRQSGHIEVLRRNGFEGLKALLPPPSRRGVVLMDPSYELKTDYADALNAVSDGLRRFATGTFVVWYPVIARPEAHGLPRKLKALAQQLGKPSLHATLSVGSEVATPTRAATQGKTPLRASGVFVINPPHTLKAGLKEALPWLENALGQGRGQGHSLESTG